MLISGHMRTYKKCYNKQLKNLIESNNPDIFIYTSTTDSLRHEKGNSRINSVRLLELIETDENYKKDILDIYGDRVKDIFLEKEKEEILKAKPFDENYNKSDIWQWHRKAQFEKLYKCYKMMEKYSEINNIKYDVVIRCRPDIIFKRDIDIGEYINKEKKQENKLYCFGGWPVSSKAMADKRAFFDGFAFGSYDTMKKYCSVFLRENPEQGPFTPENQIVLHLNDNNIYIKYLNEKKDKKRGKQYEVIR